MKTNLKFNSAICTSLEQSERLLALGLKKETADMSISTQSFDTDNGIKYSLIPYSECKYRIMYNILPAWSLHRLIEILGISKMCLNMDLYYSPYEEIIHRIEIFINSGEFNKEYLDE